MNAKCTKILRTAAAIAAGVTAAGLSTMARAQDAPPPVVADTPPPAGDNAPPTAADTQTPPPADAQAAATAAQDSSVYNWKDVPANQQVVIDRAVFDPGGYQLYCRTGETIVVPFVDHNLYVMKFGRSDGGMYFVNDGATPTLYVPQGGYLENSAAEGARWYPFPPDYTYTTPIYISVAPDWDDYISMAWYPDMGCYGGYWGRRPYGVAVSAYAPLPGFYFTIYDHPYYGWSSYHAYYVIHPENRAFFRTAPVYRYDRFPARGAAYYGHNYPFCAARPFGFQDHDHSGNGSSGRPNPGSPSAVWGTPQFDGSGAPAPVFGSHVPFGSRAAAASSPVSTSVTAGSHTPFGGAGASSAAPGSATHHFWGDGSPRTWSSSSSGGGNGSSSYSGGAGSSHMSWGGGGHSSSGGSEHSSSSQSHSGDKSGSSGDGNKKKP